MVWFTCIDFTGSGGIGIACDVNCRLCPSHRIVPFCKSSMVSAGDVAFEWMDGHTRFMMYEENDEATTIMPL